MGAMDSRHRVGDHFHAVILHTVGGYVKMRSVMLQRVAR